MFFLAPAVPLLAGWLVKNAALVAAGAAVAYGLTKNADEKREQAVRREGPKAGQ